MVKVLFPDRARLSVAVMVTPVPGELSRAIILAVSFARVMTLSPVSPKILLQLASNCMVVDEDVTVTMLELVAGTRRIHAQLNPSKLALSSAWAVLV
jgi:hypothetical protein